MKAKPFKALPGGCVCGAVRYRISSAPMFVHCCHCRDCQRQAGAPFVVNAMIEADRIAITRGAPTPVAVPASSKSAHHIFRCPDCQSPLWSRYGVRAPMRYLRVATLDAPEALPPSAHIFVRSKPPWVALDDGTPAYATWYDRAKLWPPESLARLQAARAG